MPPSRFLILLSSLLISAFLLRDRIVINLSPSIPPGLYRRIDAPLRRGALVLVCLPESVATHGRTRGYLGSGSCADGSEPVGKWLGAVAGDRVRIDRRGIAVNGILAETSAPRGFDSRGRPMPVLLRGAQPLQGDEVVLFSAHPKAWDSRYFGPVSTRCVVSTLVPLWTWD